jgi:hypothetical protein
VAFFNKDLASDPDFLNKFNKLKGENGSNLDAFFRYLQKGFTINIGGGAT